MKLNLEKILNHRIVLISGNEGILRKRALEQILDAAGIKPDDFDVQILTGAERTPFEWINLVSTMPFIAKRRIVIVRHLLRLEPSSIDEKASKIKSEKTKKNTNDIFFLPPSGLLILVADEEQGDETKQRRYATLLKSWEKWVTLQKGIILSFKTTPKDLREAIKQEANKYEKSLSPRALETLVEMTGGNLSEALAELEKVLLYAYEKNEVKEQDVQSVVVGNPDWNVYKMVDAAIAGQSVLALQQLYLLLGSHSRPEEVAYSRILPTLSRQINLLWQARLLINAKASLTQKNHPVVQHFPKKPNLFDEQEWSQARLMRTAKNTNIEKLSKCLTLLVQTDAKLKGILPASKTRETLEQMLLEMAEFLS